MADNKTEPPPGWDLLDQSEWLPRWRCCLDAVPSIRVVRKTREEAIAAAWVAHNAIRAETLRWAADTFAKQHTRLVWHVPDWLRDLADEIDPNGGSDD